MKNLLSVSQSVSKNHLFSKKTTDMISLKFHTKLWLLKDKKVRQLGKKNLFWGKNLKYY